MATTQLMAERPTAQAPRRPSLADIVQTGSGLPNRYILHGCEKLGKTTFAAQAPAPVFIMTSGETGLETLIDAGQLVPTPHFPETTSWEGLLAQLDILTSGEHAYKTLVIDTLNGAERLCHEYVCRKEFGGNWGERGFSGYGRGFEVSLAEWRRLLAGLDRLRLARKLSIVCLCHTKIAPFINPEGADYDRYQPDLHRKTWSLTHKWADCVMFLNFETHVTESDPKKKGKARSSQERVLFTERRAAFDAGNRLGLPTEIPCGTSGMEAWRNFIAAIAAAKNGSPQK